jgi:hypothetical protein
MSFLVQQSCSWPIKRQLDPSSELREKAAWAATPTAEVVEAVPGRSLHQRM